MGAICTRKCKIGYRFLQRVPEMVLGYMAASVNGWCLRGRETQCRDGHEGEVPGEGREGAWAQGHRR